MLDRAEPAVVDAVTAAALDKLSKDLLDRDRELAWALARRRATAQTIHAIEVGERVHDPSLAEDTVAIYQRLLGLEEGAKFAAAVLEACRWPGT